MEILCDLMPEQMESESATNFFSVDFKNIQIPLRVKKLMRGLEDSFIKRRNELDSQVINGNIMNNSFKRLLRSRLSKNLCKLTYETVIQGVHLRVKRTEIDKVLQVELEEKDILMRNRAVYNHPEQWEPLLNWKCFLENHSSGKSSKIFRINAPEISIENCGFHLQSDYHFLFLEIDLQKDSITEEWNFKVLKELFKNGSVFVPIKDCGIIIPVFVSEQNFEIPPQIEKYSVQIVKTNEERNIIFGDYLRVIVYHRFRMLKEFLLGLSIKILSLETNFDFGELAYATQAGCIITDTILNKNMGQTDQNLMKSLRVLMLEIQVFMFPLIASIMKNPFLIRRESFNLEENESLECLYMKTFYYGNVPEFARGRQSFLEEIHRIVTPQFLVQTEKFISQTVSDLSCINFLQENQDIFPLFALFGPFRCLQCVGNVIKDPSSEFLDFLILCNKKIPLLTKNIENRTDIEKVIMEIIILELLYSEMHVLNIMQGIPHTKSKMLKFAWDFLKTVCG